MKVAKIFVLGNNTTASIELFLQRPQDLKAVFPRALHVLKLASSYFAARMSGASTDAAKVGGLFTLPRSASRRTPADADPPFRFRPGLN